MATWDEAKHHRRPDGEFSNYPTLHQKPIKILTPSRPRTREEQLAAMDPETRALSLAQEETRRYNPGLQRPLGTPDEASSILQSWLKGSGMRMADSAYVIRHPNPGDGHSNSGRGPDGEPMVALHPDRWDYGTLAHEAAHLLYHQETPETAVPGSHGSHGRGFVDIYARLLNRVAKGAGDDLKAAYSDQVASRALTHEPQAGGHAGDAETLHQYWVHGEGAKEIRWGTHGDFDRCTRLLEEHAHFTPEQAHGYCNLAHHAALGIYPATHAAEEKARRDTPLDVSATGEILRAGKWKHEWVPVDYTAAKIKGHGHVPKGWQPGGKITKPPDAAPVRHGWEPGPNDRHIQVEQVGTSGTSMGAFHRRKDAAHLYQQSDGSYEVRSHDTHEVLGQVRPSSKPGHFVGESVYEPTGETNREYHGPDFMKAVHGVLGHPAYGYSWYRVKRGPGADVVKSRKPASRALAHEPQAAGNAGDAGRDTPLDMSAAGEILRWNPSQQRVPAGGAGGGQFAPASAASSSSAAKGKQQAGRPTPTSAHPVGEGETGRRVHDLQERLNALGAHLAVDGKFGPKTLAAVRAYQKAHGLKVDGLVGPKTTASLRLKDHPARHGHHHGHHGHHAAAKTPAKTPARAPAVHPAMAPAHAKRSTSAGGGYDADGLDGSWDGDYDLPDLTGLGVADFEAGDTDPGMSRAAKPGTGARFAALKGRLAAKGASDPGALAAYIGRKKYGKAKFTALASAARKKKGGRMSRSELFRSYPLEDYHIVRTGEGDSSGRVVEAYMTVFGEATEIRDHQGHYREDIDRAAFNKRIADLERSRNGFAGAKVFYNHGMTIHGSPSDRYSMPVAVCEGIRAESRGPLTRSRYLDTPLGNEVLEMWRSGAVTAQSFTGAIIRSSPELRPGEKYKPRNGQLPRVQRLELGLKEFGPTPFPAYQGAELVGVRMSPLGTWTAADDDEDEETGELGRLELDEDVTLPPDGEAAAGGPPEVHPTRDHAHRLYALRTEQMLRDAGIASLKGGW